MGATIQIFSWILCYLLLLNGYEAINSKFHTDAVNTINVVEENLQIQQCINGAKETANSIDERYGDRHFAILWISMYSRECMIDKNLLKQDKNQNAFPFRLNKEIRCLRNSERDPIIRETFVKVRDIIDASLDVLGFVKYTQLYRGMSEWKFINQKYFVEEGFFSTSADATPALRFARGKYFIIVQEMHGVKIENYVQDKFKYQKEVVGKSGKMFEINNKTTDSSKITQILSNLAINWDALSGIDYPNTIVYITEVSDRSKLQTVINQQWPLMENYCSIDDVPSSCTNVKGAVIIQVIQVVLMMFKSITH